VKRAGITSRPVLMRSKIGSSGFPLALYFFVVLAQMDMVVDFGHPRQRDAVMLAIGAIVLVNFPSCGQGQSQRSSACTTP